MAYATINKPSNYFDTKLYTGTGSAQSITGLGFSPDFVWIKDRTSANNHRLLDIVRGATKELYSSTTDAETTQAQSLTAFNSDGFSIGNLAQINTNTNNYVSWNWDANGAGVSNTQGSITSTVSANTTSGFSIVSYTGNGNASATFGHGLGAVPQFVMIKRRDVSDGWQCWGSKFTRLVLNGTNADLGNFPITRSSTLITLPSTVDTGWNSSGGTYISYCFAEVKGYSKFGSYTGNGSTDGTFIYTGFKPAFVMIKSSSDAGSYWVMLDVKRNTFNVINLNLYANVGDSETTDTRIDTLSNGFKLRGTGSWINTSNATYIYMAFAEQPLVGTNNVPATAR